MFEAWGRVVYRRRWIVLVVALAAVGVAGAWGSGVFGAVGNGGFYDESTESGRAQTLADHELGRSAADVLVLYSSQDMTVAEPEFRDAVSGTLDGLPGDAVVSTTTYWSTDSPSFVGDDGHETYAVLSLAGDTDAERVDSYDEIADDLDAPGLSTQVGGGVATNTAASEMVKSDLATAEELSLPILLVVLVIIFGGLVAASIPLLAGGVAIIGGFAVLRLITLVTDVSIFALNVSTILGLGLAIDYGLFMVSRFREETRRGVGVDRAIARTMATAGRTVAVSGVTVAVSLAGLTLFPQVFLRSMAFGGIATIAVDLLAALTLVPALLAVLGPRLEALSVRAPLRRLFPRRGTGPGAWYRIAHGVMRRPVAYLLVTLAVLVALGLPFAHMRFGGVDERVLPSGTEERVVAETVAADFSTDTVNPVQAVVSLPGSVDDPATRTELADYTDRLAELPGATDARVTGGSGHTARVSVSYEGQADSDPARDLVERVRDTPPPAGASVLVGGTSARILDQLDQIRDTLPWMLLVIALATFVLLFLAFGSVVLPIKAIVMNVLSLSAVFGVTVWIFQDGHLSDVLGFTPTGTIDPSNPILMLAIVFGLSMDYEVFLLSRIREQYDRTGDNRTAVATGLSRTGGIITSSALLLFIVVAAMAASGVTFIKLIGFGMAVAVLVDATIVRALLVPAAMRLLGRANWWSPRALRGLYARYGMRESDRVEPEAGPDRELESARR